jgi:Tfp pilus assembly protein PilF
MQLPADFQAAFEEARQHQAAGRFLDAERIFRHLAESGDYRHFPLEALADLYFLQQRFDESLSILTTLAQMDPDSVHYAAKLANLLNSLGKADAAIDEYLRLLRQQPGEAIAHFNVALLYKKQRRYREALSAFEEAVRHGIDQPEDAYAEMGTVHSEMLDAGAAREMFERALHIAPGHIQALFNLAGLCEESGDRDRAIELYERVLSIEPNHWKALARLAYTRKVTAADQALVGRLRTCIDQTKDDKFALEVLYFALGKAFDDLELYDEAAASFVAANQLSRQRVLPYSPDQTEHAFDRLIEVFDSSWITDRTTDSEFAPIFICGMYRSGSTLLERMLAGHLAIAAGGELQTLPWLVARFLGKFPNDVAGASKEQLQHIADEYEKEVSRVVSNSQFITDKRPDNFLRVPLIKAIFPKARIIQTRRDIRDNSLSIYFQQFSRAANYANDLQNIAHYYQQQERLFAHWQESCSRNLCVVDYENLVEEPEAVLRRVLEFLGLGWDPGVLDFRSSAGLVKTYSIWQVREGLHSRSRDRWRNYRELLGPLAD